MVIDPLLHTYLHHFRISLMGDRRTLLDTVLQRFSAIPYENLTKIISVAERGQSIVKHTPEEVLDGFIRYGTGGTCFPLTLTLLRLIRALGFEAHPILADRRYGPDTHCAIVAKLVDNTWFVIDPGYLLTTPLLIPMHGSARYKLPLTNVELRCSDQLSNVELHTDLEGSGSWRYRLTYKTTPVDEETFHKAWDRSFGWEMMTYPVISRVDGETQIYIQKNILLVRTATNSMRVTLDDEALIREVASRLSISERIIRQVVTSQ